MYNSKYNQFRFHLGGWGGVLTPDLSDCHSEGGWHSTCDTLWQGMASWVPQTVVPLFPQKTANDFNLTLLVFTPAHLDGLSGPSKKNCIIKRAEHRLPK